MASCKFQHFRQIRSLLSDQGLTFGVSYHRNSHEKRAIGYARFPPRADLQQRPILTATSEVMPPKGFEPKDDKSRREDCRTEHNPDRSECLLLARREPGQ